MDRICIPVSRLASAPRADSSVSRTTGEGFGNAEAIRGGMARKHDLALQYKNLPTSMLR